MLLLAALSAEAARTQTAALSSSQPTRVLVVLPFDTDDQRLFHEAGLQNKSWAKTRRAQIRSIEGWMIGIANELAGPSKEPRVWNARPLPPVSVLSLKELTARAQAAGKRLEELRGLDPVEAGKLVGADYVISCAVGLLCSGRGDVLRNMLDCPKNTVPVLQLPFELRETRTARLLATATPGGMFSMVRQTMRDGFPILQEALAMDLSAASESGTAGPGAEPRSPGVKPVADPPPQLAPIPARLLAVLEFTNKLREARRAGIDGGYFADTVRATALDEAPNLRVMDRENILVLLKAQGKALEGCEGECDVETGKRLGADLVVSGEILEIGTQLKIEMWLHETRTGTLLSSARVSGEDADQLDRGMSTAVHKLLLPLHR